MALDIEVSVPTTKEGTDIVTLDEMRAHLRIVHTLLDDQIRDAVNESAEQLHGIDGLLNRTILPLTWKYYLTEFPPDDDYGRGWIELPYPPLKSVTSITYRDANGATQTLPSSEYLVRKGTIFGTVERVPSASWPGTEEHLRAVTITYQAGYDTFPVILRRLLKLLAAHHLQNPAATVMESRVTSTNHKVAWGLDQLVGQLRVPLNHGQPWE